MVRVGGGGAEEEAVESGIDGDGEGEREEEEHGEGEEVAGVGFEYASRFGDHGAEVSRRRGRRRGWWRGWWRGRHGRELELVSPLWMFQTDRDGRTEITIL